MQPRVRRTSRWSAPPARRPARRGVHESAERDRPRARPRAGAIVVCGGLRRGDGGGLPRRRRRPAASTRRRSCPGVDRSAARTSGCRSRDPDRARRAAQRPDASAPPTRSIADRRRLRHAVRDRAGAEDRGCRSIGLGSVGRSTAIERRATGPAASRPCAADALARARPPEPLAAPLADDYEMPDLQARLPDPRRRPRPHRRAPRAPARARRADERGARASRCSRARRRRPDGGRLRAGRDDVRDRAPVHHRRRRRALEGRGARARSRRRWRRSRRTRRWRSSRARRAAAKAPERAARGGQARPAATSRRA